MTASWISPLLRLGSERQINDEDVWSLPYEFQHSRLHALFRELQGSVLRRLLEANGLDLIILMSIGVVESMLTFSRPVLLQQLLRAIEDNRKEAAVVYGVLIGISRLAAAQTSVLSLWISRRAYERSRGEMITMIYEKTLNRKVFSSPTEQAEEKDTDDADPHNIEERSSSTISRLKTYLARRLKFDVVRRILGSQKQSQQPHGPASTGKILNLMKNDVYGVAQRFWEVESLVKIPLALFFSISLIWNLLGWSCFIGVVCIVAAQVINLVSVRLLLRLEKVRRSITDTRLSLSSQYIEAIRHLRWYDWQGSWMARILKSRQDELYMKIVTGLWWNAVSLSNNLASSIFPVVAFAAYTLLTGNTLRVDLAFPALQLFSRLDRALRDSPTLITTLLNASVALGRINDFMDEPNRQEIDNGPRSKDSTIKFEKASFSWPGSDRSVLKDVNVKFGPGLNVVYGRVGQGKTALLQAILGELDQDSGVVYRPDEMFGYCTQSTWLQSMSIRDNILFAAPYDEPRYRATINACALIPDLESFKDGDLSNIGENGIGLSGGQKARVALARAVYSRAQILLLDDPLAALDHDTATYIVRNLLQGSLVKGRNVVLVTHRVDLVNHIADQICEVHEGLIKIASNSNLVLQSQVSDPSISDPEVLQYPTKKDSDPVDVIPDKFIEDEHRQTGGVVASVYWRYIKAGDLRLWVLFTILVLIKRLFRVIDYYFLKEWSEAYGQSLSSQSIVSDLFQRLPRPEENVKPWLLFYLGLAIIDTLTSLMMDVTLLIITYTAGKILFGDVLTRVSGANFRFYDTTPVGRLMNRLTSDFGTLDGGIGGQFRYMIYSMISWISAITIIASTTPTFLVFSIMMTFGFVYIFLQFLPTSQSLRRLEMVSLTPLMTNFGILLEGLATVRAFRAQAQFQDRIIAVTDSFQKMDHFYWSLQTWLLYRFDLMAAIATLLLTLLALYEDLSPGLTAFVLTTASSFVAATDSICHGYGSLQMDFVSVERVVELLDLDQEDRGDITPPAAWPSNKDDVVFDRVTIRYAEHLPPALQDATFHIPAGSTTAIIGRTGSGKSTLALSLLATIRPDSMRGGSIKIGSIDLSKVDVHILRQRVTFIAQDPVLFPGTLRQNLDPNEAYSDTECEAVLEKVLSTVRSKIASTLPPGDTTQQVTPELTLLTPIATGGKNLSQGQRQLLGLGRAILRRGPVVILDEATASIDGITAIEVQRVLREELQQSTVIMIAHRVEAVREADWVIALDKGRVVEVGRADEIIAKRFAE